MSYLTKLSQHKSKKSYECYRNHLRAKLLGKAPICPPPHMPVEGLDLVILGVEKQYHKLLQMYKEYIYTDKCPGVFFKYYIIREGRYFQLLIPPFGTEEQLKKEFPEGFRYPSPQFTDPTKLGAQPEEEVNWGKCDFIPCSMLCKHDHFKPCILCIERIGNVAQMDFPMCKLPPEWGKLFEKDQQQEKKTRRIFNALRRCNENQASAANVCTAEDCIFTPNAGVVQSKQVATEGLRKCLICGSGDHATIKCPYRIGKTVNDEMLKRATFSKQTN